MALLRWLTFLFGSQTMTLTVLHFSICFYLLMPVFILQWLSLHWEILIMLSQFPLTFCQTQNGMPCFIKLLMTILRLIDIDLLITWDIIHWSISLNSVLSAAACEFCEWVQGGVDVYIPHCKYQVKPHSFLWCSAACAAVIVNWNWNFFLFVPIEEILSN